jgi:penicillin amidase
MLILLLAILIPAAFRAFLFKEECGEIHDGLRWTWQRNCTTGVVEVLAPTDLDHARALGWIHAKDRLLQMMLVRAIGQGRLQEFAGGSEEAAWIDGWMRQAGMAHFPEKLPPTETDPTGEYVRTAEAYAAGVNDYLEQPDAWLPPLLRLIGYSDYSELEPWTARDCLVVARLMGFVGLAEVQDSIELFLIQSLATSGPEGESSRLAVLRAIFDDVPSHPLDAHWTPELDAALRKVDLSLWSGSWFSMDPRNTSDAAAAVLARRSIRLAASLVPKFRSSNNWAIASSHSATGGAIYASDPHLNTLQLPAVWYESLHRTGEASRFGISVPGAPFMVMGRTDHIAMGMTYGCADLIDYFVEECREDACLFDGEWVPLVERKEVIRVRGQGEEAATTIVLRFTGEGRRLEVPVDPAFVLTPGFYISRAFTHDTTMMVPSSAQVDRAWRATSAREAADLLSSIDLTANYIIADVDGRICYQQTGAVPARASDSLGLLPVNGSDPRYAWRGLRPATDLVQTCDPAEGFLVTANDLINPESGGPVVNFHLGTHRESRIRSLLQEREGDGFTVDEMREMQADRYSPSLVAYQRALKLNTSDPLESLLASFDGVLDGETKAGTLLTEFTRELYRRLLSLHYPTTAWPLLDSSIISLLYHQLDEVILAEPVSRALFPSGEGERDALLADTLHAVLAPYRATSSPKPLESWAASRTVYAANSLLAGKAPWLTQALGIDFGPLPFTGGPGTVNQGLLSRVKEGVWESFAPSWRFITDLSSSYSLSVLPGGVSGRVDSELYTSDYLLWLDPRYKEIHF